MIEIIASSLKAKKNGTKHWLLNTIDLIKVDSWYTLVIES